MEKDIENPVFMVCVEFEHFESEALAYACEHAKASAGRIGLFQTMVVDEFQNWASVEDKMKQELREAGEKEMWQVAGFIKDNYNMIPEFYFEEGEPLDALKKLSDQVNLAEIIVAAEKKDFQAYLDSKKIKKLNVPIVFVPERSTDIKS